MQQKLVGPSRGGLLLLGLAAACVLTGGCHHKQKDDEPRPSVEELTQQTQSNDKDDRYIAVKAAGDQAPDNKDAIPLLIQALSDKDPAVRWEATHGLEKFGAAADAAIPRLRSMLHDSDSTVRAGAARALSAMGVKATGALSDLNGVLNDPNEEVRDEAKRAIRVLQQVHQYSKSNPSN